MSISPSIEQYNRAKVWSLLKNLVALTYVFAAYIFGIALLFVQPWWGNLLGVLLTAHSLLIASVFIHEFIHSSVFKSRSLNVFWGRVMMHLNGACYATWSQIYEHHINHHVQITDFIPFDYASVKNWSPWLRKTIQTLEWLYIPAFEYLIRLDVITSPFTNPKNRHLRVRTLFIFTYRAALFVLLALVSLKAFLLYTLAYFCFVSMMRLVDTFHHTFEYTVQGQTPVKRDRIYEQKNTFSNVVSVRYPWLNLFYLNFGYHNAHHYNMRCPWHELPQLHNSVFGEASGNYGEAAGNFISFWQMFATYHKFRAARVGPNQGEVYTRDGGFSMENFMGALGVSFLTPP
ncbi:MAG: fatty acid desaturase [Brasilonema angustatum HA4187-MV1]|jgi:fatty acid desaturase|nr:fatty acid desaturase [Brasilonema angustatum HA4187-MV1]